MMKMDFIRNALKIVNFVMVQEMRKVIIVQNVKIIFYLLMILYIKLIVMKNVNIIIILINQMVICAPKTKIALELTIN